MCVKTSNAWARRAGARAWAAFVKVPFAGRGQHDTFTNETKNSRSGQHVHHPHGVGRLRTFPHVTSDILAPKYLPHILNGDCGFDGVNLWASPIRTKRVQSSLKSVNIPASASMTAVPKTTNRDKGRSKAQHRCGVKDKFKQLWWLHL